MEYCSGSSNRLRIYHLAIKPKRGNNSKDTEMIKTVDQKKKRKNENENNDKG